MMSRSPEPFIRRAGHHQTAEERGAILPLFLLMLPVIILFVGAAIDLSRWSNMRRADEYFGQLAALKGLQVWMANSAIANNTTRLATVKSTVENSLGQSNYVGSTSYNPTFHATDKLQGGVFTAGFWYFNPAVIPAGSTRFVAVNRPNGIVRLPPLNVGDPPEDVPANAMMVEGAISTDAANRPYLIHHFMPGFSQTSNIRVIASVTPRIQAYLVDTTPNLTQTSHLNNPPAPVTDYPGRRFGYLLTSDNPSASPNNDSTWATLSSSPLRRATLPATRPDLVGNPLVHLFDDYNRIVLWNDDTRSVAGFSTLPEATILANPTDATYAGALDLGNQQRVYRLDQYSPQQGTGPMPLQNIFAGISTAISYMQTQAVTGDKVCIILFDNTLAWTRTIPCTGNLAGVLQVLAMGGADPAAGNDAGTVTPTDPVMVNASQSRFRMAMRKNWFPNTNAFTDMQLAYNMAIKLINDGGGDLGVTRNSITFITDGMNNVSYSGTNANPSNTAANHLTSIGQLQALVGSTAGNTHTAINTILIGDEVAPNSVQIRAPGHPWRCMTIDEMRRAGVNETYGDPSNKNSESVFQNARPGSPYQYTNVEMASLSQSTGGIFAPVLRPSGGANCYQTPISSGNPCPMTPRANECDVTGRTQAQQIDGWMPQIVGSDPYNVVHVGYGGDPAP